MAFDIRNAFNSVARGAFLPIVASHFPEMVPWVNSMYAEPTHLFVGGKPDKPSTLITSARGTRQGCPLGAQLFALALHPHLCALARLVGENGLVIACVNKYVTTYYIHTGDRNLFYKLVL